MTNPNSTKRTHRTPEQKIADLEAEIERVKRRAAMKEAKSDPAVAEAIKAARFLNRAHAGAADAELQGALTEARGALDAFLESKGIESPKPRQRRSQRSASAA